MTIQDRQVEAVKEAVKTAMSEVGNDVLKLGDFFGINQPREEAFAKAA